ncbi:DMT family transporter [Geomonas subterranea]|uniref:DMT family transporter n=1 Tax=Geomonas subterranea TaxID=2847989 RepID=A0ABX8LEI9_9BACT|nr:MULTISPECIES: DMT family transporter [Geomonas]QXE90148.1 DMT family transporter [Geomonas subterranea]QXM07726.1 DMT family transporter [Geomonas subterranea]
MSGNLKPVYLKLVLTTFFWGGTFVAARLAVKEAPPFFAAATRFAVAAACLIALTAWYARREKKPFPAPRSVRESGLLLSLGLTGIFCYNALFFTGLKLTTATSGALIVAINPLLTAVISALWLRERVSLTQGMGLMVSLLGVCVVISKGSWAVLAGFAFNKGDLIMLGAPLCWALYSILGKKALATFTPLAATAYASLFGAALLLPAALVEHAALGGPWPSFSWVGWLAILQLALLGTVVGFVWWYQGVGRIGASRAAVFVNLVPFFGALQAALVLGERVVLPQLCGGLLVVAGVYWGSRVNGEKQQVAIQQSRERGVPGEGRGKAGI